MKNPYSNQYSLLANTLSIFDISATLQENDIKSFTKSLSFDIQQLSKDQLALAEDYKKASDRITQDLFGDRSE